jgi:hypothetical protein
MMLFWNLFENSPLSRFNVVANLTFHFGNLPSLSHLGVLYYGYPGVLSFNLDFSHLGGGLAFEICVRADEVMEYLPPRI